MRASVHTPMTKHKIKIRVHTTMMTGHREIQQANVNSVLEGLEWFETKIALNDLAIQCWVRGCFTTRLSPADMSTMRKRTRSRRTSRTAKSGGRKRSTRMKATMTQRPMKRPNSRRGFSTLAKFAKKLTAVVNEVARQPLPACKIVNANRASVSIFICFDWALWFQKSTKTKTTSQPMPTIKKIDMKEAMVVFSAGARTKATGTEVTIMRKLAILKTMLCVCTHM
mmetsp:Transcript_19251/g.66929  ORF Transcript_19251/g.66929 Transcript_19251/m.66929 type:complete len:225 (+) Transcript_19251:2796-3470(+)